MSPATVTDASTFLDALPEEARIQARSLMNAWISSGGDVAPGKVAVRLLGPDEAFTAGTIHAPAASQKRARLELCRVILERHGVSPEAWTDWSDEFVDLGHHGFDQRAKYPTLPLGDHITPAELARLVTGLRDLAALL